MITAPAQANWYAIQCKPRQEWRALEHLERQGYPCFLPTLVREHGQQGCKVESVEVLFPRYLFIRLDETSSNWYPIRSTRGVCRLVHFNSQPLPVADDTIELIRERSARRSDVPRLQPGERVKIVDGPFADLEAIFVANDGEDRIVLLMDLLQREQRIHFPTRSVCKA